MIKANEKINIKNNNLKDLEVEYFKARKDEDFKKFTDKIKLKDDYLMKYTSSLLQCFNECENCKKCKGLSFCENEVKGCKNTPVVVDDQLIFEYKTCKYQNKLFN